MSRKKTFSAPLIRGINLTDAHLNLSKALRGDRHFYYEIQVGTFKEGVFSIYGGRRITHAMKHYSFKCNLDKFGICQVLRSVLIEQVRPPLSRTQTHSPMATQFFHPDEELLFHWITAVTPACPTGCKRTNRQ